MTTSISLKDQQFISAAAHEAANSVVAMRHGCVAVVAGKVIAQGHNTYRASSRDGFLDNTCTCHAEISTIRKIHQKNWKNSRDNYRLSLKVASHQENI